MTLGKFSLFCVQCIVKLGIFCLLSAQYTGKLCKFSLFCVQCTGAFGLFILFYFQYT